VIGLQTTANWGLIYCYSTHNKSSIC